MNAGNLNLIIECPDNLMTILVKYSEKNNVSMSHVFSFLLFCFLSLLEQNKSEKQIFEILDSAFCNDDEDYRHEKKNGGDLH